MGQEFQPKLAATKRPWTFAPSVSATYGLDKITRLPVLIVLGSVLQGLLSAILPARWAFVPLLSYLAIYAISTVLNLTTTSHPLNVVPGRATAQLPLPSGSFRTTSAEDQLVVFHIGAQFNHALGPLCPGGRETGEHFGRLAADLRRRRAELGVLAISDWRTVIDGSLTLNTIIYFKDVANLHAFAHEPMHREAWDWFAAQKFPHLGVFHETFLVPAKNYESVYLNCKPTLLGAAASHAPDEKTGEERWVNALVGADTPALKTQYARMGRNRNGIVVK